MVHRGLTLRGLAIKHPSVTFRRVKAICWGIALNWRQKHRGKEGRVFDPSTQLNLLSFLDKSDFLLISPIQRQGLHGELVGADT